MLAMGPLALSLLAARRVVLDSEIAGTQPRPSVPEVRNVGAKRKIPDAASLPLLAAARPALPARIVDAPDQLHDEACVVRAAAWTLYAGAEERPGSAATKAFGAEAR